MLNQQDRHQLIDALERSGKVANADELHGLLYLAGLNPDDYPLSPSSTAETRAANVLAALETRDVGGGPVRVLISALQDQLKDSELGPKLADLAARLALAPEPEPIPPHPAPAPPAFAPSSASPDPTLTAGTAGGPPPDEGNTAIVTLLPEVFQAHQQSQLQTMSGNWAGAQQTLDAALQARQAAQDTRGTTQLLGLRAELDAQFGQAEQARQAYEQCCQLAHTHGYVSEESAALQGLARLAWGTGQAQVARQALEQSLALQRAQGSPQGIAMALTDLATLDLQTGNSFAALQGFTAALEILGQTPDLAGRARALFGQGQAQTAALLQQYRG